MCACVREALPVCPPTVGSYPLELGTFTGSAQFAVRDRYAHARADGSVVANILNPVKVIVERLTQVDPVSPQYVLDSRNVLRILSLLVHVPDARVLVLRFLQCCVSASHPPTRPCALGLRLITRAPPRTSAWLQHAVLGRMTRDYMERVVACCNGDHPSDFELLQALLDTAFLRSPESHPSLVPGA